MKPPCIKLRKQDLDVCQIEGIKMRLWILPGNRIHTSTSDELERFWFSYIEEGSNHLIMRESRQGILLHSWVSHIFFKGVSITCSYRIVYCFFVFFSLKVICRAKQTRMYVPRLWHLGFSLHYTLNNAEDLRGQIACIFHRELRHHDL